MTIGTRDIRGVDTNPKGREPMKLGRKEVAGSTTETILTSNYGDGQVRAGINPDNVNSGGSKGYNDAASKTYRESLRGTPYPGQK